RWLSPVPRAAKRTSREPVAAPPAASCSFPPPDRVVKLPVVAVVGRPNVGKSTFFNRGLGERLAIVEDRPGVTRDRNFARAEWAGRHFYIVDTGGMVDDLQEPLDRLIRQQVITAIEEADVVVQ